ncbi:hypothetical protein [Kineococcus glutinatus]|uniref:ABC transporter n=1 Tax=Kineococcus glutinatus TaxID=1070872 RepID=A0ABP9I3H4_9ACTN
MSGVGYHLRLLLARQSAVPPVLAVLAVLAVLYATDAGPPVAAGALTAAILVPVTAWLHRAVTGAESPPFADATLVRLGGGVRRQLTWCATTLLVGAALGAVSVLWAVVANPHPYPVATVALLALLHAVGAWAGTGLGCLVSRPLRVRTGTAVLVVTGGCALSLAVPWLPPAGPLLAAFASAQASTADRVGALAAAVAFGALAAVAGTWWGLRHR